MDDADQAAPIIEAATEAAISRAREGNSNFRGLSPSGFCSWCGEPVGPGRLHCAPIDNDCEADHLKYIRFRRGSM